MVLVLGGRGFIGKAVVRDLIARGLNVRLLTRTMPENAKENVYIDYWKGDLLDANLRVNDLLSGCRVIINCAGELKNKNIMHHLHVDITKLLVNAAKDLAKKQQLSVHWVQLSSVGAYGPTNIPTEARFVTELTPVAPRGEYEITKTKADEIIQEANDSRMFTYSILRPSNVFGKGMPNNSLRQLGRIISKGLFFYIGRSGAISTYVHVDDVSYALMECAFNTKAKGQIFNLSFDCPQEDLIEGIAKAVGVSAPRLRLPYPFVKGLISIFGRNYNFPLSETRVHSLVARTSYSVSKISEILDCSPQRYPPAYISDAFQ